MNWRDERRRDRLQEAEIRRADRAAEREQARRDQELKAKQARDNAARRKAAVTGGLRWLAARPVELLMAAIIVVPGILAWSAMSAYGREIYGPLGVLLPLFTEAAMWAFAFQVHQARAKGASVGGLQVGTWTFATVAGVLNYLHGLLIGGPVAGIVMAAVSVGGVVAHQLLTTSGFRTREQRRADRTRRLAAKRVARMERAAVRRAVGELADDGTVRLVHRPGLVTLRRAYRIGWHVLADTTEPGLGPDGPDTNDTVAEQVEAWLATQPVEATAPESTPGGVEADSTTPETGRDQQESRPETSRVPEPSRRSIAQLRAELVEAVQAGRVDPSSAESIRKELRCAAKTSRQLRDEWNDGAAGTPAAA